MSGARLFRIRRNQFVAFSVNIDNLYLRIILQMLAQLGDLNIHRTRIEIVVVNPDCLQCKIALQDFICMRAEQ